MRSGPEAEIQVKIIKALTLRGWFVKSTHGNAYQSGFPDLYCIHKSYGQRWVEIKYRHAYQFTSAQLRDFPQFEANGVGIWILTDDTEVELAKLHKKPNWKEFLKYV